MTIRARLCAVEKTISGVLERYVIKAIAIIGVAILTLFMLLTVVDVALRYLFGRPLVGTVEIVEAAIVTLSFLVLAWTTQERSHVRLDVLFRKYPTRVQRAADTVFDLFSSAFMIFLTYSFIKETIYRYKIGEETVILNIPVWLIYAFCDLGLVATTFILLFHLFMRITGVMDASHHES